MNEEVAAQIFGQLKVIVKCCQKCVQLLQGKNLMFLIEKISQLIPWDHCQSNSVFRSQIKLFIHLPDLQQIQIENALNYFMRNQDERNFGLQLQLLIAHGAKLHSNYNLHIPQPFFE